MSTNPCLERLARQRHHTSRAAVAGSVWSRRLVARVHPGPRVLQDVDYAALADLNKHTLRDIGASDWVQEERRRELRVGAGPGALVRCPALRGASSSACWCCAGAR